MTSQTTNALPTSIHASPATLAKATGGAALAAAAILVLFVLPAEAGIDPTGAGAALGIAGMVSGAEAAPAVSASLAAVPAAVTGLPSKATIAREGTLRTDTMTITLAPHSGQEVKAHMRAGDGFVFNWKASGGPVKVDMHGERPNAADGEFTSYWEDRAMTGAQGNFTAPFEGTHGWYWRNKGDVPVTVTVSITGFYKDLFQPAGE